MIPLKGRGGGPIEKIILGDSRKIAFLQSQGDHRWTERAAGKSASTLKAVVSPQEAHGPSEP